MKDFESILLYLSKYNLPEFHHFLNLEWGTNKFHISRALQHQFDCLWSGEDLKCYKYQSQIQHCMEKILKQYGFEVFSFNQFTYVFNHDPVRISILDIINCFEEEFNSETDYFKDVVRFCYLFDKINFRSGRRIAFK